MPPLSSTALAAALGRAELRGLEIFVPVVNPGTVGGSPCAAVTEVFAGFDWDSGKCFLKTEQPLSRLTTDEVAAITTSVRKGQSWHAYQAHTKAKLTEKNLNTRIAQLEKALRDSGVPIPPPAAP